MGICMAQMVRSLDGCAKEKLTVEMRKEVPRLTSGGLEQSDCLKDELWWFKKTISYEMLYWNLVT